MGLVVIMLLMMYFFSGYDRTPVVQKAIEKERRWMTWKSALANSENQDDRNMFKKIAELEENPGANADTLARYFALATTDPPKTDIREKDIEGDIPELRGVKRGRGLVTAYQNLFSVSTKPVTNVSTKPVTEEPVTEVTKKELVKGPWERFRRWVFFKESDLFESLEEGVKKDFRQYLKEQHEFESKVLPELKKKLEKASENYSINSRRRLPEVLKEAPKAKEEEAQKAASDFWGDFWEYFKKF
jgi:hypothetical protein